MVTTLDEQFRDAHVRIGIERANAIAAHLEVRAELEADSKLREWGVDTILIGSYARKTSIHPCHDVDVFVKLPGCPPDTTPEQVFTEVQRVLVAAYGERAKEQRRSMKVEGFADDLSVDAVPAVLSGNPWKIPQTDRAQVGGRWVKDRWEETNPERLSQLTDEQQSRSTAIDGERSYRRTVRLIRQTREAHLGEVKPGGLYFELLTFWAFAGGVSAPAYGQQLADVLEAIANQLESGLDLIDPGLNEPYAPAPDPMARTNAAVVFRGLARGARGALDLDDCAAAVVWRRILGSNDRGPCFPIPRGCSESGQRITAMPQSDRGPRDARPFA